MLRAEFEEIKASRERRGLSAGVVELQSALDEDEKSRPQGVRSRNWRARLWDPLEGAQKAHSHDANSTTETPDPLVSG